MVRRSGSCYRAAGGTSQEQVWIQGGGAVGRISRPHDQRPLSS